MLNVDMIKRPLDGFLQSMDEAKSQHMTQKDGYLWGIEYLQDIKKELLKLEERAKSRNDPRFLMMLDHLCCALLR